MFCCSMRVFGATGADPTPQTVVMRDGRSAGFGFVDFIKDEAAKSAIEEMNNSEYVHISSMALGLSRDFSHPASGPCADATCG